MSWVTNILLSFSVGEDTEERIDEVNVFFENVPNKHKKGSQETYEEASLASIEPLWEGKGKSLECNLFVGAYDNFPLDDFITHLQSVNWEEPESVQLFVQGQEDLKFQIIDIFPLEADDEVDV